MAKAAHAVVKEAEDADVTTTGRTPDAALATPQRSAARAPALVR
ncbi:hypothetical protein ACIQ7Q_30915 [Streptomyces sp. NPDC096176]